MNSFILPDPLKSWEVARGLAERVRASGGIVVSTNGCFDILHPGHVSYLAFARSLGDFLIVGINSDKSVSRLKGPKRPIQSAEARACVLSQLRSVDAVCVFNEETPVEWLKSFRPQIHVKGGDYDPETMPESQPIKSWGGRIQLAPFIEGFSTTSILGKI